jgi:protein YIPF5/7
MIRRRVLAILTFQEADHDLVAAPDLWGPVAISLALGVLLLLGGKMHFSDIEGAFIIGSMLLYVLFNFMNKVPMSSSQSTDNISLYTIMSFMGYALLPMLFLAVVGIFTGLASGAGAVVGLGLAGWSSWVSSAWVGVAMELQESRVLVAYPLFLFYVSFAMIIIF